MPGDGVDVQEPEDQQRDGDQAHEGQRHDEEQRETVQATSPLSVAASSWLFEDRKRLGRHPGTDLTNVVGRLPSPSQTSRKWYLDYDRARTKRRLGSPSRNRDRTQRRERSLGLGVS
jgi:hypothetical protein